MDKAKPALQDMGIEIVEFDAEDKQVSATTIPLGHYLHETDATAEEMAMTAQLAAIAGR